MIFFFCVECGFIDDAPLVREIQCQTYYPKVKLPFFNYVVNIQAVTRGIRSCLDCPKMAQLLTYCREIKIWGGTQRFLLTQQFATSQYRANSRYYRSDKKKLHIPFVTNVYGIGRHCSH